MTIIEMTKGTIKRVYKSRWLYIIVTSMTLTMLTNYIETKPILPLFILYFSMTIFNVLITTLVIITTYLYKLGTKQIQKQDIGRIPVLTTTSKITQLIILFIIVINIVTTIIPQHNLATIIITMIYTIHYYIENF